MDIGRRVKLARASVEMTQRQLAKAAGLSAVAIIDIEKGRSSPNIATIEAIAQACGLALWWFFWPWPNEDALRMTPQGLVRVDPITNRYRCTVLAVA